jgi:hypothetical protein
MAESMVSVVVGLLVLALVALMLTSRYRHDIHRERMLSRMDGHRWWERQRHRH